jgi:hypothetical protein
LLITNPEPTCGDAQKCQGKSLGEIVRKLILLGIDLDYGNVTCGHGIPEGMPLCVEVFGVSRNTLVRGQGQGAVVVFEDSAAESFLRRPHRWRQVVQ